MKRQQRLTWLSPSPKWALAVAAPVLVVAVMLAAVAALPGCATESNGGFQDGGRGGMGGKRGF